METFWIISLPFLVCVMCLFLLRWLCYTREQVMLQMMMWKSFLKNFYFIYMYICVNII